MRAFIAAGLRRLAHKLEPIETVVHVHMSGDEIVRAVQLRNKRRGLGSAGI